MGSPRDAGRHHRMAPCPGSSRCGRSEQRSCRARRRPRHGRHPRTVARGAGAPARSGAVASHGSEWIERRAGGGRRHGAGAAVAVGSGRGPRDHPPVGGLVRGPDPVRTQRPACERDGRRPGRGASAKHHRRAASRPGERGPAPARRRPHAVALTGVAAVGCCCRRHPVARASTHRAASSRVTLAPPAPRRHACGTGRGRAGPARGGIGGRAG